ncbi:mannose-6-phosphate isomerase [Patiriisocius marinistellae]|uniref:Mannose-6-phosphate isomerase n=1 Tax=Patiriisocius marinistellae TaxID=2494560 RepID=A0A5J4FX97_9FLAO|nr:type I phosphomannose isomerase catalytic subunit [Patiriisocius marinistellae]GEQ86870.1 mannose-6-phosphate isomerase [Patiriisocius marinistellae]
MKNKLHLLKFNPILKEKVWGGTKLKNRFNKDGDGKIGESWELSGVEESISIVANGELKGYSINYLIEKFGESLMGKSVYNDFGNKFPLLFKFIDAAEDLSVQLHPDDALAHSRHNSFGKTEMWYIMDAEEKARLIIGFKDGTDKEIYQKHISEGTITKILVSEAVTKGDCYFIAPGTVHAIGAGVVLAEIQQTSDITYRIYDWDRPDLDGKMRQLHTDKAIDAIKYDIVDAKISIVEEKNSAVLLKKSDFFITNKLVLSKNVTRDLKLKDSFIVYMCVAGYATIIADDFQEKIQTGETILVPQCLANVIIKTQSATLLEVYIP